MKLKIRFEILIILSIISNSDNKLLNIQYKKKQLCLRRYNENDYNLLFYKNSIIFKLFNIYTQENI